MSWLYWYIIVTHCFVAFFLYKLTEDLHGASVWPTSDVTINYQQKESNRSLKNQSKIDISHGTSVWCYGHDKKHRICKFRNLCYSSTLGEYIFFHGLSSVLSGVPKERCSPALLDMTSVENHNIQYFNYQDAPVEALNLFRNITVVDQPSLIFHRFNPENLMHVIHDDLIPLFHTLKQYYPDLGGKMASFNEQVQLVFMEGRDEGPFYELYKIFSEQTPILGMVFENDTLVCFREAMVGISKATTWYDYGFKVPQAPIKGHTASAPIIHQFVSYATKKLKIVESKSKNDYVVLFAREVNRLILNEFDLSVAIATTFNLKVVRLSLETNSLTEIIERVRNSVGVIAMHGSILSLAVFLHPGTFLVELFPYAVNPENYTPYKTLAQLPGMQISYNSWGNKHNENTVMHPNRTTSEGGIAHLSLKEQDTILNADTVPKHLCCNDPHWLFRIYQDTIVDTKSFLEAMRIALDNRQITDTSSQTIRLAHPGQIKYVYCEGLEVSGSPAIFVSWQPSWNSQFFDQQALEHEIWMQTQNDSQYMVYALETITEHTFADNNIKHNTSYSIWIRGVTWGNMGPFSDICKCMTI